MQTYVVKKMLLKLGKKSIDIYDELNNRGIKCSYDSVIKYINDKRHNDFMENEIESILKDWSKK